ncbi:alpha/beta-hydrolase [Pluteus cervinus]|uniref:Alpha/beta-hydrolase n=1 Tax=Pluteus cervinus TaxID=181527 RepID=A0ACD3BHU5_9AGAR|nr:alpha/beta-hydrolase [Pluteus cervinus]
MQSIVYKHFTTSRQFDYAYYYHAPDDSTLPVLMFLHGFPSTSQIWSHQLTYFQNRGFGLLAPDMLGFGGSSKPTDPHQYRLSLICQDLVELLDAENLNQVVIVGHDLGSKVASRLANLHDERFMGYAFLADPYNAPHPKSNIQHALYATRRMCGYELCGHTLFFAEEGSAAFIHKHIDSFFNAVFPVDPKMWVTEVAPIGALKRWLQADKTTALPPYFSKQDFHAWKATFVKYGLEAPLCWHQAYVIGLYAEDDKEIPTDNYIVHKPVFFAAARHDYISWSTLGIATTNRHCRAATIREFSTGHWLMISSPSEVNHALFDWVMDVV